MEAFPEPPWMAEPPWMERVRRIGWALMLVSLGAMAAARLGPTMLYGWAVALAAISGSIGLLAIVNIALVRTLYRRIGRAVEEQNESE